MSPFCDCSNLSNCPLVWTFWLFPFFFFLLWSQLWLGIFAHTLNHLLRINLKQNGCAKRNRVFYDFLGVLPELLGRAFPLRFYLEGRFCLWLRILPTVVHQRHPESLRASSSRPALPLSPLCPSPWLGCGHHRAPGFESLGWWGGTVKEEGSVTRSMGVNRKAWLRVCQSGPI